MNLSPEAIRGSLFFRMEKYIVIVAGGTGSRMKSDLPKQFIELKGLPILMHTIRRFQNAIPSVKIVLALSENFTKLWGDLCEKHNFSIAHKVCNGGETRFHSVKNALALVPNNVVVGIHDAARPLVNTPTILNTLERAQQKGNASPSVSINESIRETYEGGNKAVDRDKFRVVQTPQCFQSTLIKKAFLQKYSPSFTDDASVLEATGATINLVEGNKENIKITTPEDLLIAEAFMAQYN